MKLTTRCGSAKNQRAQQALAKAAEGQAAGHQSDCRADTTVARANVSYPTDLGLLAKGNAVRRNRQTVQAAGGAVRTPGWRPLPRDGHGART